MSSHWKQKFPALTNHDIAYLDTASSCQLPAEVIQSISHYLQNGHGNPHRGMYPWSEKAEQIAQQCRKRVARLLSCNEQKIAFTKSTTESINIVANSLRDKLNAQHTIIVTQMEHHANLLPWQRLCQQTGAQLKLLPLKPNGELDLTNLSQWLSDNCALFAFTHVSNVIGTINPVHQMVQMAKQNNVPTLIDGAQAIAHQPVNITEIDCDYYAFSGHKLYAAGGIGVLYARNPQSIEPLLVGGGIVNRVTDNQYHLIDEIFVVESGSANMTGIVGLNAALDFFSELDIQRIIRHEKKLIKQLTHSLENLDYRIISHRDSQSQLAITHAKYHSHDIASILADKEVAVRAGHHCAQPCLSALGVKHCIRASVGLYNTSEDINRLVTALSQVDQILAV